MGEAEALEGHRVWGQAKVATLGGKWPGKGVILTWLPTYLQPDQFPPTGKELGAAPDILL